MPGRPRRPEPRSLSRLPPVETADFPVYLTGLGTVQGFNTVLVRTRVDGQINRIAFQEGQFVKEGDTLVEIDPRPFQAALDQAKAKKVQDEANLANANLDLQRFTKLGEFATRQQTDTQRSTVAQLTAQIAADTALIENAQTQLDYATIKAPFSGVAGLRQVDVGNIVNAATQTGIVTIAQIEPIAVIFTAPEDQLPEIKAALAASPPKVIALSTDGKRVLSTGTLALTNNQVDTTSGTIRLKAVFDNKDHALWPGQSVSTRLLIKTLKDATVVPDDAVQHGPDGLYAYAVNTESKAELRKIKVTNSFDGRSVVDEGLSPGQQVITSGQYKVQPGALVSTAVASSDTRLAQGQAGMSDGISAPFIRYPIGTSLLMAGILFVGLVAYPLLPVAPLPQVDFPTIQVAASLPGASPETMASSVAQPLERQLAQIPGIAQMTSTSYLGTAAVTIQFDLNRNIDGAANDVQAAINAAGGQLPKNLPSPPTYRKVNPADSPILLLSATSDTLPLTTVCDAVDAQLAQQISQISGVAQVTIGGQQKPAIRVQIDPAKLVAKGLSLEDVRSQIAITTVDSPKGNIDGATRAYTIYANDQLTGFEGLERRHRRLPQWRPLAHPRHRPGRHRPGRRQAGGLGQRQARRVPDRVQAARRQRHRDRRQDQGDAAAAGSRHPAGDQDRGHQRPHPDHPRRRRRRTVHPAPDHRAGRDGDLRLPAQFLGHRDPDRHGAAGAARRLRADVGVRLYARQSVADGAHDRGRLRGRRRHRDAGKHYPLYRGG